MNAVEIQKRNKLLVIILWVLLIFDLVINFFYHDYSFLNLVEFAGLISLMLFSFIVTKKILSPIESMYAINFIVIGILFLVNYYSVHFVNLVCLFLAPLLSLMYRNWKLTFSSSIVSAAVILYFLMKHGESYFIGWQSYDFVFFLLLFIGFSSISMIDAFLSERTNVQLNQELDEIKRLHKKLTYSEVRYRSMLKQSTEGIFAFDPDKMVIVETSQRFCKMLGYTEQELINKPIFEIIQHDQSEIVENVQEASHKEKFFVGIRKYKRKDGVILAVEVRSTAIETENNERVVLVNVRDVTEQLKSEYELKMTKNVVDSISDGAMVTNLQGDIVYINPGFKKITGYSNKEAIGNNVRILKSYKHDSKFYQQFWERLLHDGEWEGEFINKRKNGEYYVQDTRVNTIYDEKKNPMFYSAIIRDITEEKEIRRKLEENEQKYQSLFENHQGIIMDMNHQIIDINSHPEDLIGYTKQELLKHSIIPLINRDKLDATLQFFEQVKQGKALSFETQLIHKNGQIIEININAVPLTIEGEIVGIIGIVQDITKQKHAERELKLSEHRYRSLIKLYPEVVFVHGREKIEYLNDKAVEFIGANHKSEIMGRSVIEFLHPDDQMRVAKGLKKKFENNDSRTEISEFRFVKLDGSVIIGEVSATMIEFNGKPALLGVIRDVTKKKEAEIKLKEANEILKELSKLDGLTGIPNRRFYDEMLQYHWNRATEKKQPLSLIMLDIDQFKIYNDTYGHIQGDQCLKEVANALRSCLTDSNHFVARYGGEEFSIILPNIDIVEAKHIGELLREHIELLQIPHKNSTVQPHVTISLGVASMIPTDDLKASDLIKQADYALYQAKNNGRNRVENYLSESKTY